ncbi:hypothetical protein ACFWBN_02755 [Streptomyces sp. NPDC059989]
MNDIPQLRKWIRGNRIGVRTARNHLVFLGFAAALYCYKRLARLTT